MVEISALDLFESHHLLSEYKYQTKDCMRGYSNRTLYIDLSNMIIKEKTVSEHMKKTSRLQEEDE